MGFPQFLKTRDSYKKIIIAPVVTSHLNQMDWWQKQNLATQEELKQDTKVIAAYMREAFVNAVKSDQNQRYTVVSAAGPNTLIVESAIVELVPSKAFFNAASTVGSFFVPGLGLAATAGKGSVAIEVGIKDSQSGKVLATMADRELAQSAVVDVAAYSWYDSAKDTIQQWAQQFVQLANTDLSEKVSDSMPYTLVTW